MTNSGLDRLLPDRGSFRDTANRVYRYGHRVLRGVDAESLAYFDALSALPFYQALVDAGDVVKTVRLGDGRDAADEVKADGWAGVLEHDPVSVITYPYEWPFAMLKDAALLHLRILEQLLEHGWTTKDGTPYNIQWQGSRPVFIDTGSFVPWRDNQPWVGYRQFCSLFLIPLMMQAHLGIDAAPLLRSKLDGVPPMEAARYFRGRAKLKPGVLSHVVFPSMVESGIAKAERDDAPAQERTGGRHSRAMVIGLVQGLARLVRRLEVNEKHSDWSHYAQTHSYSESGVAAKQAFVTRVVEEGGYGTVWDIGCNTGTFSRIAAAHSEQVVAMDADRSAVDRFYRNERERGGGNVLPLVADLGNLPPAQGWAGQERVRLEARSRPDLILCLALVHHMRVSANVPLPMFLSWLRGFDADVLIEFVGREDPMFRKLITNKAMPYADYSLEAFLAAAEDVGLNIVTRTRLTGGDRDLFLLRPRQALE